VHHWDFHFVPEKSLFPFGRARQLARRGGSNLIKDPKTPSGIICIIFIKPFSLDTQLNFNKHRAASYMRAADRERERDRQATKAAKTQFLVRDNARSGNFYHYPAQKGAGAVQPHGKTRCGININMKCTPTLVLFVSSGSLINYACARRGIAVVRIKKQTRPEKSDSQGG
jgi:hypothetical protein